MTFCAQCGQPVDGGQFCGNCGAQQERPPAVPVSEAPTGMAPMYAPPQGESGYPGASPQQSPSPGPKKRQGNRIPVIITVIALAIAVGGGGALFYLNRDGGSDQQQAANTPMVDPTGDPTTPSPTSTTQTSTSPTTSASPTSPTSEKQAVSMLNKLAGQGEKQVPIDNKYLISLSLKWVGITDDSQQPGPFSAMDIWNHFQTIIDDPKYRGEVKIVRDGHFGNQISAGKGGRGRAWVAVIDPNLPTEKAGFAWCKSNFTERGEALNNVCYPRKASPPHD